MLSQIPSCETHFYNTGLIGCEGAQVLNRWAQSSDSRGQGIFQVHRQERDTTMHQSVRIGVLNLFWAGNSAPFMSIQLRFLKEPVVQTLARIMSR